jgi:hypothetical protein
MASLARVCLRGALAHGSRSQITRNLSVSAVTKKDYGEFVDVFYVAHAIFEFKFWSFLTKIVLFYYLCYYFVESALKKMSPNVILL